MSVGNPGEEVAIKADRKPTGLITILTTRQADRYRTLQTIKTKASGYDLYRRDESEPLIQKVKSSDPDNLTDLLAISSGAISQWERPQDQGKPFFNNKGNTENAPVSISQ